MHYPALNLRDNGSISRLIFSHDPILNLQTMRCVLECYLGNISEESDNNSLISPLFGTDEELKQFPRTVLIVGDVDPLIDDSTSFYHKLQTVKFNSFCSILISKLVLFPTVGCRSFAESI